MDYRPPREKTGPLSMAELLVYARQWYFDLTTEVIEKEGFTFEECEDTIVGWWDGYTIPEQRKLGHALRQYRAARNARDDATGHLAYATAYRGAPDDTGEGWRPTFEYYVRRRQGAVSAEENFAIACTELSDLFGQDDAVTRPYVIDLAGRLADSCRAMEVAMKTEMAGLKAAADEKVKSLDKGKGNLKQEIQYEAEAKPNNNRGRRGRGKGGRRDDGKKDGGRKGGGDDGSSQKLKKLSLRDFAWKGRLALDGSDALNLWLGVENNNGKICKRAVHKEVDLAGVWYEDHYWTNGAPGDAESWTDHSIPTELHAHQKLTHSSGSNSIVQLLGYTNEIDTKAHLYLEWCPHGDLSSLVQEGSDYCSATHGDRHHFPHEDFSSSSSLIPEPFCWAALLSMVKAGLMMERGQVDAHGANPDWVTMVHRDLKVSNVFLGSPGQDFGGYPQPKVGDFGIVILAPSHDTRSAEDLYCVATADHAAPEMMVSLTHPDGSYVRQSTKTNVWGIGMILYSLLTGRFGPAGEDVQYLQYNREDKREPPEFDMTTKKGYSLKLRDLVMACLRYEAKDRPTFDFLLEEILASTNGSQADLADSMRSLRRGVPDFAAKYHTHRLSYQGRDKYAIGLSFGKTDFEDHDSHLPWSEPPPGLSRIA